MWRLTLKESVTTSWPKTRAQPASGSTRVARTRTSVDLPLPLGPITPVVLPRSRVRSSGCRATTSEPACRQGHALRPPPGRRTEGVALAAESFCQAARLNGWLTHLAHDRSPLQRAKRKDRAGDRTVRELLFGGS